MTSPLHCCFVEDEIIRDVLEANKPECASEVVDLGEHIRTKALERLDNAREYKDLLPEYRNRELKLALAS